MNEAISIGSPLLWAGFPALLYVLMLALDLFVFGAGKAHKVSIKEAASWSLVVRPAIAFNAGLWWHLTGTVGSEIADRKALSFFGYLIEKSLSVDNVFVFLMIFSAFAVKLPEYQRRVLIYGVLGAIGMRIVMILLGAWVVQEFKWVLYIFGAFYFHRYQNAHTSDETPDPSKNWLVVFRKHLRVTDQLQGEKFSIRQNGVRYFTPLFLVLILIEVSDLVFAVDSIPAILPLPQTLYSRHLKYICYFRPARAVLLLADIAERFHLLKYGLAIVLAFIGTKMLIMPWFHMPVALSLAVVVSVIGLSVVASLWVTRKQPLNKHA